MKDLKKYLSIPLVLCGHFILVAWALSGCDTVVEIDLPNKASRLTINTIAIPDSTWTVRVSGSASVLQLRPGHIFQTPPNTQVKITGSEGEIFLEQQSVCRWWDCQLNTGHANDRVILFRSGEMLPQEGKTYTLEASAPGFGTAMATITIPRQVKLDRVEIDTLGIVRDSWSDTEIIELEIRATFTDPGDVANSYALGLYEGIEQPLFVQDPETGQWSDRGTILVWQQTHLESADPTVFVSNGWLLNQSGTNLLFNDNLFNGQQRTVRFRLRTSYKSIRPVLKTVHQDLWRYLRSADEQDLTTGNPLAQPVPVFSNIQNGFGIFGAFAYDYLTIEL